ncbi:MAG: NYN domain-containing protein [Planctomycetota bacterium JB042]
MGNAALLIDLENFYIGREESHKKTRRDEPYEFPVDLDSLCEFARDMSTGHRLTVARAYANFNDRRPGDGDRRWDYYLQPLPRFLMEQGIEPVQVFRFPGGSNKNAADMRLAMDATALMTGRAAIDLFLLVTGDSDFIPVVIELKRGGAKVMVIGVSGCTKPIFNRYCDRFEYFEDLLAARELQRDDDAELEPLRSAVLSLLERRSPIRFAAVKPLLSDELGAPFDPNRFGCETTGDFLRKYAGPLGVTVRKGEHDWEIGPFDPDAQPLEVDDEPPAAAPTNGIDPRDGAAPDHLYRELLRQGIPRCYVVPMKDWVAITDVVMRLTTDDAGDRVPVLHQDLLNDLAEECGREGVADAGRKVSDVTFQLFKAGCFHCADDDAEAGQTDFHWSRPARLAPEIADADALRARTWRYLIRLLDRRLEQRGLSEEIDPAALAEVLVGKDATDEDVEHVRELVRRTADV